MRDLSEFTLYATEDGSIGFRGYITDLLEEQLLKSSGEKRIIYACGPNPMLKALEKVIESHKVSCQVSVETLMACGMGVCMGCPVELKNKSGTYVYACKEGPVFNINEINLSQTI